MGLQVWAFHAEALFVSDCTCSGHTTCSVGGLEQNAKRFRSRVEVGSSQETTVNGGNFAPPCLAQVVAATRQLWVYYMVQDFLRPPYVSHGQSHGQP